MSLFAEDSKRREGVDDIALTFLPQRLEETPELLGPPHASYLSLVAQSRCQSHPLSHQARNSDMVPTELIYEIIDQLPLPHALGRPRGDIFRTPKNAPVLRAGKDSRSPYAVLSSSPHLRGYIRTLHLRSRLGSSPSDLLYWVLKIFDATDAVDTLILDSGTANGRSPSDHLPFDSMIPLLSRLPSLRCLQLIGYRLRNPFELQSLLTTSTSLRELKLQAIYFDEEDYKLPIVESGQGLQLESLSLAVTSPKEVDAMLNRFTLVDIEHLKSLSTDYTIVAVVFYAQMRVHSVISQLILVWIWRRESDLAGFDDHHPHGGRCQANEDRSAVPNRIIGRNSPFDANGHR
ncbi:hypothetical protein C8R45DRAFT_1213671 [Mycena sanguinolenta]|nr:hypothetical protein C8R45DRAFT_1213671 [Mycena sanguinolenta]